MKKLIFSALMLGMGLSNLNAQVAYQKAKAFDNVYVGAAVGASTNLRFNPVFPLNGMAGVKLGKNFSPVWGANIEVQLPFGDNNFANSHTFVKGLSYGLNLTTNFTNLFKEYTPERSFELSTEFGMAKGIIYGDPDLVIPGNWGDDDELLGKAGLIFAWNLGEKKAWQLYAEPQITWNLTPGPGDCVRFNSNYALAALMVGVNYKFMTSNGTHNFKIIDTDDLNNQINDLRAQLAAKPKEVVKEVVKEVIKEVPVSTNTVQEITIDNLYFVTFQQGKSILTAENKKALDNIQAGRHVQVVGTCSPEGSKELNDRLSQARADVVAEYLKGRGVIVDEATGKGVQGVTSNRLAVVYVK